VRFVRGAALFFAAMLVQWWWNAHMAYGGVAPQFLLALTVVIAARRGPLAALLVGYAWGLYADVLRADLFGANALLYALAGYAAGMVRRQIDLWAVGPLAASVFLMSWAYTILMGLLGLAFLRSFVWPGWTPALVTPFLNSIAAVAVAMFWDLRGDRR
jgi:rod shape-determining protein MreD